MATELERFWLDRDRWPNDWPSYIFLLNAFERVGKAMFGAAWTGTEGLVAAGLDAPNLVELRVAVRRANPGLPDAEVKTLAQAEYEKRLASHQQAWERATEVRRAIAVACASEQLQSFVLWDSLGSFSPVEPAGWRSDVLRPRFLMGRMNTTDVRNSGYAGDRFQKVFLGEASLEAFLAGQPHYTNGVSRAAKPAHDEPALGDLYLSPYMQVMVTVIRKFGVTEAEPGNKESLKQAMKEAWNALPGPVPLSDSLADSMATLIRHPSAQAGRNRRKGVGGTREEVAE